MVQKNDFMNFCHLRPSLTKQTYGTECADVPLRNYSLWKKLSIYYGKRIKCALCWSPMSVASDIKNFVKFYAKLM